MQFSLFVFFLLKKKKSLYIAWAYFRNEIVPMEPGIAVGSAGVTGVYMATLIQIDYINFIFDS